MDTKGWCRVDTPRREDRLHSLSELAGRNFASTQEALENILQFIVQQLGMRSSYVTHIVPEEHEIEVLLAHNAPSGSDIPEKASLELSQTF